MTNRQQSDQNVETSVKETSGSRLVQIDGLRALAALSVVSFHYTTQFERNFQHTEKLAFDFSLGYLGVNLFFVISGFVIYMTLDKIHAPLDFVVSRFSRLFPPYWVAILLTWGIVTSVGLPGYTVSWKEAVVNLTMLQSFFSVRDVDGVYWSLQVELVFYVWMLILWVTKLFFKTGHSNPVRLSSRVDPWNCSVRKRVILSSSSGQLSENAVSRKTQKSLLTNH